MRKDKKIESNRRKYEKLKLTYKVDDTVDNKSSTYEKMKVALEKSGFLFDISSKGILTLEILESKYVRKNYRNAGRKPKTVQRKDNFLSYRYSDIVCMMQTMTDAKIYKKIGMSSATYYRHKKELISSSYYAALDKNMLGDIDYLRNQKNDYVF